MVCGCFCIARVENFFLYYLLPYRKILLSCEIEDLLRPFSLNTLWCLASATKLFLLTGIIPSCVWGTCHWGSQTGFSRSLPAIKQHWNPSWAKTTFLFLCLYFLVHLGERGALVDSRMLKRAHLCLISFGRASWMVIIPLCPCFACL